MSYLEASNDHICVYNLDGVKYKIIGPLPTYISTSLLAGHLVYLSYYDKANDRIIDIRSDGKTITFGNEEIISMPLRFAFLFAWINEECSPWEFRTQLPEYPYC
jgi:hypothetical protein